MKKLMFVLMVLSLLAGSCLASYSVSGKVYQKGTVIPVPGALVTLSSSSGLQSSVYADATGSYSIYWGGSGVNEINNSMTLKASKNFANGQLPYTATQNTEYKNVEIKTTIEIDPSLDIHAMPAHWVGVGSTEVISSAVIQNNSGVPVQVQNVQVNVGFAPAIAVNEVVMTNPAAVSSFSYDVVAPGQLQVNIAFDPPKNIDFPAESFFDVFYQIELPETDATVIPISMEAEGIIIINTMPVDGSSIPSITDNLAGEAELCKPHFLVDSQEEWQAALDADWPQANIIPMLPTEWSDPNLDFGYMAQWGAYLEEGEPYPPVDFIEPELYVWEGDGDEGLPEPDDAGLVMRWGDDATPDGDYGAAWKWDYGLDPDLSNCIITVTATPPPGINNISLGMQDVNGLIRSWQWTCGPAPAALPSGVPTTITIDTTKTGVNAANPPASGYASNPGFDLKQVQYIVADENGTWVASQPTVPPGGIIPGIWNYWHNLSVTPKLPATGTNSKWYVKYSQPPVEMADGLIRGWDEVSIYDPQHQYPIMADDWKCEDKRPVTDIHWWGSFKGWTQPHLPPILPKAFRIGIWTDVPDDPADPDDYSHPGKLIWENECTTAVWNFAGYDWDPRCEDPTGQYPCEENEACFQWAQFLNQDEWFWQEPMEQADGTVIPNIYWLSIAAVYDPSVDFADPDFYPWGWKTRDHYFMDDAIRITDADVWPPVVGAVWTGGTPVEFPQGISWDLAFELTTNEPKCPGLIADLNEDCIVDLVDFSMMAQEWLMTSP